MRLLILVLIFSLSLNLEAQNFKFGKVSDEEVAEKVHPLEPTANAAVLYKNEIVYFVFSSEGFVQMREVHERIKIYNKEGFDWATKRVVLYRGGSGSNELISKINGNTYNLENGKVIKDKLTKSGIFEEDSNEYIRYSTLTMPNVKEGSVIEYSYLVTSPFLAIDDVLLQYEIPINQLEVKVATPEYFRYNKTFNLKAQYVPKIIEGEEGKTALVTSSGRTESGASNYSRNTTSYLDYTIMINESNIPALKEEELIASINNYRAKLGLELTAVQKSGGGFETYSTTWEKVSKTIYDSPNFGEQIKRSNFYASDIEPLLVGISEPFTKAFLLQNFVRSKVKWNGLYGYYAANGIRNAYKDGSGNVADINLLLVSMLQASGVNANPVLISTRNNGIPLFPTRSGFNYVVCMVETDEGYALFDATENFSSPNVLPTRALNWQGRLIKSDGSSSWASLIPTKPSLESTSLNVKINQDLSASGTIRKRLTDHIAYNYRNRYANTSETDHVLALEKNKGDLEIEDLKFENAKDVTKPIDLSYNYHYQDAVENIGDKLYLQPMLFLGTKESPFKTESRLYPVDFTYPLSEKYMVNVAIPEGYKIEVLPRSEAFVFKDDACAFKYIAKENGAFLQFNISLDINTAIIDVNDYQEFKSFFQKIIEKQAEQVVLTKA